MKKYNLSEIMKKAWATYKKFQTFVTKLAFAECLKRAWAEAKKTVATLAGNITLNIVKKEKITIDMTTGGITGKTYNAKEFLKSNLNAKWDGSTWTVDVEKVKSELTTYADYYSKYIVEQKEIAHKKLVNRWDGFYSQITYTDGTVEMVFVG